MVKPISPIRWKTPIQQRSRDRFDRILNVSGQLLDDGGMNNLTMEKVAQGAETSIGSVYHFFPDREALIAALVSERSEEMLRMFSVSPAALALSVQDAVTRMFDLLMGLLKTRPGVKSLLSMAHSSPEIQAYRAHFNPQFLQSSAEYLNIKFPRLDAEKLTIAAAVWHHSSESFALLVASQPRKQRTIYAEQATNALVAYLDTLEQDL